MASSAAIGCIADDFTGATDVASSLVEAGLDTRLLFEADAVHEVDCHVGGIVVALKTRTAPVKSAVVAGTEAGRKLIDAGCARIYFKYCSTFDSTAVGNIGPVADALLELTGGAITVVCPSLPNNRRSVYQGHLFVGSDLLSESPMRNHPVTPMTDSSVVRLLSRQTRGRVGLIPLNTVGEGPRAVAAALTNAEKHGYRFMVTDATCESDLDVIAAACRELKLSTGAAGLAGAIGRAVAGAIQTHDSRVPQIGGFAAVVSGSASQQTRRQIDFFSKQHPAYLVDPCAGTPLQIVRDAVTWATKRLAATPILIAADTHPQKIAELQKRHGVEAASALVEAVLADITQALVQRGVRRLLVAGGETAGSVLAALGIRSMQVGPSMAPGIPWNFAPGPMAIGLKSGNFGTRDLFSRAFVTLSAMST